MSNPTSDDWEECAEKLVRVLEDAQIQLILVRRNRKIPAIVAVLIAFDKLKERKKQNG